MSCDAWKCVPTDISGGVDGYFVVPGYELLQQMSSQ